MRKAFCLARKPRNLARKAFASPAKMRCSAAAAPGFARKRVGHYYCQYQPPSREERHLRDDRPSGSACAGGEARPLRAAASRRDQPLPAGTRTPRDLASSTRQAGPSLGLASLAQVELETGADYPSLSKRSSRRAAGVAPPATPRGGSTDPSRSARRRPTASASSTCANVHEWCADWYDARWYTSRPPTIPPDRRWAGGASRVAAPGATTSRSPAAPPAAVFRRTSATTDYGFRVRLRLRVGCPAAVLTKVDHRSSMQRPLTLAVVGCGAIAEVAHLPAAAGLARGGDLQLTALRVWVRSAGRCFPSCSLPVAAPRLAQAHSRPGSEHHSQNSPLTRRRLKVARMFSQSSLSSYCALRSPSRSRKVKEIRHKRTVK